jgi:hypothetical protein
MTRPIPEPHLRKIHEAAEAAYDDIRWLTGDSRQLSAAILRLALESWRAGYKLGRQHGRDG